MVRRDCSCKSAWVAEVMMMTLLALIKIWGRYAVYLIKALISKVNK